MLNLRCASSLCVHTIQNNFSMGHFHMSVTQQHCTVWKKVSSSHFLSVSHGKGLFSSVPVPCSWYPSAADTESDGPLLKCTSSLFMVPQCSRHRKWWSPVEVYQFPVHGPPVQQTQRVMVPCWSVPVPCSWSPVQQTQKCTVFPFMRKRLFWSVLFSHSWERGYFEVYCFPIHEKGYFEVYCFPIHEKEVILKCTVFPFMRKVILKCTVFPFMRKVILKCTVFPFMRKVILKCTGFPFVRKVILKCTGFPFMRKGVTLKHTSWERGTLWALLSSTFLQTLPDLVTPLKGHSLSPRSCSVMRSAPSEWFGY